MAASQNHPRSCESRFSERGRRHIDGKGLHPISFDGENAEATMMDRSYSKRFWGLLSQACNDLDHLVGEITEEAEDPAPSPDTAFCGKRLDMQFAPSSGFPKPRSPPLVRLSSPVIPPTAFKSVSLTAAPSSSAKPTTTVTASPPAAQPSLSQASSVTKPSETARPQAPERDSKSRAK